MSAKIGTVGASSPERLTDDHDRGHCRRDPCVDVYASVEGVELCAGCVLLSLEQACELRALLDGAIAVAARRNRPGGAT